MVILIVDDDANMRESLRLALQSKHDTKVCADGKEALDALAKQEFDVVITDHQMPDVTGIEVIKKGRLLAPNTSFMMMTAFGSIEQAVEAIRLGAEDYLLKPFDLTEMRHRLARVEEVRALRLTKALKDEEVGDSELVGNSSAIRKVKEFVQKVASAPSPVLVLGDSGTGKEMVARAIHRASPRSNKPFIAVNCASLSENLIESELFGHEKGAFTGADSAKPGKFELAQNGTLFLDELGELPLGLQAKLLRVLQEKEFYRVGGVKLVKTEARVVAATNRALKEMVSDGRFREDLFFRLNVLSLHLPPLRERAEDLLPLIASFWKKFVAEFGKKVELHASTVETLCQYSFPGNIRELKNVLERLIVLAPEKGSVGPESLPPEITGVRRSENVISFQRKDASATIPPEGLVTALEHHEAELMALAMEETGQNQAKAAELLKISRGALQYKLRKYGLISSLKKAA